MKKPTREQERLDFREDEGGYTLQRDGSSVVYSLFFLATGSWIVTDYNEIWDEDINASVSGRWSR